MKSITGLIVCFLSVMLLLNPERAGSQEIPYISENDIPGLTINRNDSYDGASLWGYMNGGADIYLEYGFDKLRVQEFSGNEENIKLELFRMNDPVSAFGIYGLKTFKCNESGMLTGIDCLNDYQYQFLYGDYYGQLINESASEGAKKLMIKIAGALLEKLQNNELLLPLVYLTDSMGFHLQEIKMIKGSLGIQNKAIDLAPYFVDIDNYELYYANKKVDGKSLKYYEVVFGNAKIKERFKEKIKEGYLNIIEEGDRRLVCIFQQ